MDRDEGGSGRLPQHRPQAAPGRLETRHVDVGGRRLALTGGGAGRATVVIEPGLGVAADDWADLHEQAAGELAGIARVLRYDRAGCGQSDAAGTPRDLHDLADDLRALLAAADPPGPCVLVGQSVGGLIVRHHAHAHPADVAALVLVDAAHPDQFERMAPLVPAEADGDGPALRGFRQFWADGWRDPARNAEGVDLPALLQQARATRSLGALPLVVVSAGAIAHGLDLPDAAAEAMQAAWMAMQAEHAALSSRSVQVVSEHAGHFLHKDDPAAVVRAIRQALEMAGVLA